MNRKKNIALEIWKICLYFFVWILFSCNNHSTQNKEWAHTTIEIDPLKATTIGYSTVFDSVEYIPIPSDSAFLLGEVDKMVVANNYIFLMDKYITKSVFVFDRQGKNKTVINKQGNGPGEYVAIKDFYFDEKQDAIGIYCAMRKRLMYYDMHGQYINDQSLPFYTTRVFPLSDNYLMFCDYTSNPELEKRGTYPNVILTTPQGKMLSSADFYDKNIDPSIVWSSNPDFSEWGESIVSIKPDHCNIIYHVAADSIYPAYRLDFGKFTLDERYWKEARKSGATLKNVKDYCYDKGFCEALRMLEDKNYLFFKYKFKDKINSVFYSKKTGRTIHADLFKNDMDDITAFFPILLKDNKMYCLLSVEDIFIAKKYLVENRLLPKKLLNSVKEFDNPVIVAFTLKDF